MSQVVLRAGTGGVTCKVKEERITQDTLQIKVSVRWSAVIRHAAGRAGRPVLPSEGLKNRPRVCAVMKMKLWGDKFLVTHSSLLICKRLRDDSGLPGYHCPPYCFSLRSIFFPSFLLLCRGSSTSLPWDDETCFPCRLLKCLHSCKWRWWFGVVARCSPTGFNSQFRDKYASPFNRETGTGFPIDGKLLLASFVVNTWLTQPNSWNPLIRSTFWLPGCGWCLSSSSWTLALSWKFFHSSERPVQQRVHSSIYLSVDTITLHRWELQAYKNEKETNEL